MKTSIKTATMIRKHFIWKCALILAPLWAIVTSCEINDPIGDISRPGNITANVYWDVPLANVTAGNEVAFSAEYWSTDKTFEYLGVWYDIVRNLSYSLTYPGTGFTYSLDSAEVVREFQEIVSYTHSENNYISDKKAFVLNSTFPVSYTLSSLEYKNPYTFNQEQFDKLIPSAIRDRFLQALFPQLAYGDFKTLLVTDGLLVTEETLDKWFDTLMVEEVEILKLKADSSAIVMSTLRKLPFNKLIYNKNRQYYSVEFHRGYQLNARFRVVNGTREANFSDVRVITVF